MARLLALSVTLALLAGCSGRSIGWQSSEPDERGRAAAPICALQQGGTLSERAQLEAIEGRLPELYGCVEEAEKPAVVVASVSTEGEVQSVLGPGGRLLAGAESTCLARVLRTLRFPRPSCERPALLAFRFRPGAPPEVLRGDGTCAEDEHLDEAAIAEVIADHEDDVRLCFEQRLAANPGLRGRVAAQFVVNRGGRIAWIGLPEELPDREVGRCIVGAMRSWRFPPSCTGIVTGSHVWEFPPQDR